MKKNYYTIIMLILTIMINSCSKDGLEGPEGPAGPVGATGPAGTVGDAGKDGSIIYSGSGIPNISLGKSGDYYLDITSSKLYGPKQVAGWGNALTLMGANGTNGTNGTNGNTTLNGNGAPGNIGNFGDYYLDKTNYLLYGPKTAIAGWGLPLLLRGGDGVQGPTGPAGKDGSIIYSGNGSPVTTIGVNGDYYLNKNNGDLYGPKIASGWGTALALKGNNGANGTNGSNGTNGTVTHTGLGGPELTTGNSGDYYLDRMGYLLYGPKNVDGWGVGLLLRGADGPQGPIGPAGADGTVIYSGDYYPEPSLGKIGDYFIGKYTVTLFGPKTAAGWGNGVNLRGSSGTNGTNGSSVLNGNGIPGSNLGNEGDFYIDVFTYTMYGPKANGDWGAGTSLKAPAGGGNVIALESPDLATFSWDYETGSTYNLKKRTGPLNADSTSVLNIPTANFEAVKSGVVLVYLSTRDINGNLNWYQLNYSDVRFEGEIYYTYVLKISANAATIRILNYRKSNTGTLPFLDVKKVRIVIAPTTATGGVSAINPHAAPLISTMQKLHLQDSNFKSF